MTTNSFQERSILTSKNIFLSLVITICLHSILIFYALIVSSSDDNHIFISSGFFLFTISDIALWFVCLIPVIAIFRKKIPFYDIYALSSIFSFFLFSTAYPGFVLDPHYIFYRIFSFFPEFSTINSDTLLIRLTESELIFTIFFAILLFTNHRILPHSNNQIQIQKSEYIAIIVTGFILLSAGIFAFFVYYGDAGYLKNLFLQIGDPNIKTPELGKARFLILINISTLFFPLFGVTIVRLLNINGILVSQIKFISIFSIVVSLIPILIYGARGLVVIYILLFYILMNKYVSVIKGKIAIIAILLSVVLIYLVSVIRNNPLTNEYESSQKVLYGVFSGEITMSREKIDILFDSDRIVTVASLIQHVSQSSDMILGRSLLSGPMRFVYDLLGRFGIINKFETQSWWSASEFAKYWRFGSLDVIAGTPTSLPAEFYLQFGYIFGYISLVVLSFIYGKIIYLIRKKMTRTTSLIVNFSLAVIAVNQFIVLAADISYIFGLLFYQLFPILTIYMIVSIFIPTKNKEKNLYKNNELISLKQS